MRDLGMPAWALAAAIAAAAPGGCDPQEGLALGPDGGTSWESPVDGSVWDTESEADLDTEVPCDCADPLCGIGYTCTSGVKECPCDTVCDDTFASWGPDYVNFRCYAPCDGEGAPCAREGDACTAIGGDQLCLPQIAASCGGFDIKVVPEAQAWSIADAAQVDVELTVGEETRHLIMAFAAGYETYDMIYLAIMESGIGEYYYLTLYIMNDSWAPGLLEVSESGPALATLYRGTESGGFWLVGDAVSGSVELIETPEVAVCNGPGCPKAVFGTIEISFVGLEAELAGY